MRCVPTITILHGITHSSEELLPVPPSLPQPLITTDLFNVSTVLPPMNIHAMLAGIQITLANISIDLEFN